jgi:hypothetical protein
MRKIIFIVAVAGAAWAEPFTDYQVIEPEGTVERAHLKGRAPWCSNVYEGEIWDQGRIHRAVGSTTSPEFLTEAAEHVCQEADDPTWQKQANWVVQAWMNLKRCSQEEAESQIIKSLVRLKGERRREQNNEQPSDEERFAFGESDMSPISPEENVATATIGAKPAWCDKAKITDRWEPGRIGRTARSQYGTDRIVDAALHICQRPTDATWKKEAGYLLQQWMNWTHLSQSDAENALRARIQKEKFAADREALCKALELSPEVGGETKTLGEAQLRFFGCGNDAPLWADTTGIKDEVGFYLDVSNTSGAEMELARLYWLFDTVENPESKTLPGRDAGDNLPLLHYAVAQRDFAKLDAAALDKLLSAAPYNDYARTIAMESVGRLKGWAKKYEQAVDKLAKNDEDYTNILREAPKKAFAQWDKVTAQWKAEIERSNAFEKKLSLPSRKSVKGCSAELFKDAEKLIRSYKETSYHGLVDKIAGDPVAALLLSRLSVCDAVDKVFGAPMAFRDMVEHGRELRGPRSLAHYALVDAIAAAQPDRPKLLLSLNGFWLRMATLTYLYREEVSGSAFMPRDPDKDGVHGVIASATKVPDGVKIVWKTQKIVYPEMICHDDTHHPLRINSNGNIEYYRNCKATGKMSSQDNTPAPLIIAAPLAAGVKPGVFAVAGEGAGPVKNGVQLGFVIYTKKTAADKKISTFFGFNLE